MAVSACQTGGADRGLVTVGARRGFQSVSGRRNDSRGGPGHGTLRLRSLRKVSVGVCVAIHVERTDRNHKLAK